ncbi:hypothetical protein [Bradyrhizobium sp.]|uniref:hypothetical protein n=1 Tax=Bradyrhizobium sp. TaxID=376 RepID=UPI004037FC60
MRQREFITAIGLMMLLPLAACSPDPAADAVSRCLASNFPSYNPKDREQCIAACIKCENGVTTTCATSCSLKGAR